MKCQAFIPFSGSNNHQITEWGDKRQRRDAHILRVIDHKSNVNGWTTDTAVGDEAKGSRPRRRTLRSRYLFYRLALVSLGPHSYDIRIQM